MSTTVYQQHSSDGMYLATSSLLQAQDQLQARRNRGLKTKPSDAGSEYGNNLTVAVNKHGRRRSQQHNLPALVSTSRPFSDSKNINDSTENSRLLLDMKPRRNSDYRQGSNVTSGHHSQMTENSREDLSLRSSRGVSVISTPNIATVEDDSDSPMGKEEPDFSSPPNPIIVPSKEATTFTVSQVCQERVRTPVGSSQTRYRVSQLILDDDRPRTSPDEITKQEKAAQELCAVVSDTKWHRQKQQQKVHYSSSQSELLGDIPAEQIKNESNPKDFLQEKRSRIDLTLPLQSSLIDVRIQSPRYGRRSVMLPAARNHDVKHDRLQCNVTAMHQTEPNLDAHSLRDSRQFSSSGQGSLLHPALSTVGQLGQHTLSLPQELAAQSLPLVSTKKQSTVRSRCSECRKRLNITNVYTCRCDKLFCATHRYSELHNCTFDYKTDGRKILEQTNPLVTAQKLPKI
jgi:AN1-type zinc finger and ubiquitin domain-containing protein 1